jgi:hypothetical protein
MLSIHDRERENDEKWVYCTIQVGGRFFRYDPALNNKYG